MKLRLPILALSAAIALSLSACTGGAPDAEPDTGINRPADEEQAEAEADAGSEIDPESTTTLNSVFGETFAYTDGVSVTVSAPQPFTPSEYANKGSEPNFVLFEITVVNGSEGNYDPTSFYDTLQSANAESEEVYDSQQGLGNSPTTSLLPGREAKWTVAYGVLDPNDMVMEITPGFEYSSRIWTN
ncbi:hypothetical protein [Clavibacter michiganensis]|uniref:DUF4352 domain-containing protein n=1 Tax=Clavibacter michiganensis subsp. insidiosus TaxID=33014 RepID=A0A0D5CFT0_9MICO|nr:hypothetical protein [Clavibacter michiganensis]AJW78486.1 hypothetical protein VO01_04460 [Clavibacter michiganensis subsp. insidiosus]AWF98887.1 hypothetical protein BEH61_10265 [Clavibacter michiganensis subsp. insidiosus]AWG00891.1 hypothetical protein BEH62_04680 [Clavibacter michiganensis subsp. insidiosus]OQJ60522.1 hypothetical protein B5P21_11845 [Clavibacter michiganensis subsp. insidiosus]RII89034.1 hypothetical protein DZF92_00675 [Clavibacter michiganensis subsp. insidiosus]